MSRGFSSETSEMMESWSSFTSGCVTFTRRNPSFAFVRSGTSVLAVIRADDSRPRRLLVTRLAGFLHDAADALLLRHVHRGVRVLLVHHQLRGDAAGDVVLPGRFHDVRE